MQKNISSRKKNFSLVPFFVIFFLFLLGTGIFFYTNAHWLSPSDENHTEAQMSLNKKISVSRVLKNINNSTVSDTSTTKIQQPTPEFAPPLSNYEDVPKSTTSPSMLLEVEKELQQMFTVEKSNESPDASKEETCQQTADSINIFFTHLDKQPYLQEFKIITSSKIHFTKLINKLLKNPPIVSGETNDLFSILKNTAHFFRIIGKDNIHLLKGILDREKDSFETVLNSFYTLTTLPGCAEKALNINLKTDSIYEYAGFLQNTMGGRLYLFRRDSFSRMTVSYYAILTIDKANTESNNKHGIDIRPAVSILISEIEDTSQLKFKSMYLETLYKLKEKYLLE